MDFNGFNAIFNGWGGDNLNQKIMIQLDNAVSRYGKIILTDLKDAGIICWLAGGALRDYFMGIVIKTDYDIFFPNEDEYNRAKKFFSLKDGVEIKWESDNGMKVLYNKRTFDLIKKFFPTPQDTIDAFDFTVSMFAVDTDKVYHGETSFIDLSKRQLMINKITYPASTLSRAFRYYKKGFSICLPEMKKIIEAIQAMPKEQEQSQDENNINQSSGDNMFRGID